MDDNKFVTIVINESQLIEDFKSSSENTKGKEYSRIITPDGYTYIRPSEQVKRSAYNEHQLYFALPMDMNITMSRTARNENGEFLKNAEGKYITEEKTVTGAELSDMYKRYFAERKDNNEFEHIAVSKAQILSSFEKVTDEGEKIALSRIIAPDGSTFIRPTEQLREGKDGKMYFYLHKDMNISLSKMTGNVIGKTEDGKDIHEVVQRSISATELKELFERKAPQVIREHKSRSSSR